MIACLVQCSTNLRNLRTLNFCRTIANMDIKMDFVPPSFINFISRQLIGNGFRLYQKVIHFILLYFTHLVRSAIRPTHGGIILFNLVMIEIEAIFDSDHPTQ
jgi:hypothetical protein